MTNMPSNTHDVATLLAKFRERALGLNLSLSGIDTLIVHTVRLSINAEIASTKVGKRGVSFGTVVKELNTIAHELSPMTDQVKAAFKDLSVYVARWIKSQHNLRLYQKSVRNMAQDPTQACMLAPGLEITPEAKVSWESKANSFPDNHAAKDLYQKLLEYRATIITQINLLDDRLTKLRLLIHRVLNLAVRQTNFIAITAKIESSKVEGINSTLSTVADDVQTLSTQFAKIADNANNEIWQLSELIQKLRKQYRVESQL